MSEDLTCLHCGKLFQIVFHYSLELSICDILNSDPDSKVIDFGERLHCIGEDPCQIWPGVSILWRSTQVDIPNAL